MQLTGGGGQKISPEDALQGQQQTRQQHRQQRRQLRQHYRSLRQQLGWQQRHAAGLAASRKLAQGKVLLGVKRLAIYWDDDGEIETLPIIRQAWSMGITVYLPVLDLFDRMRFVELEPGDQLVTSKFGLQIPATRRRALKPLALDLVIAPLVAFDPQGNRLGRGGGHYDRLLRKCKYSPNSRRRRKPLFIGLAYDFQQHEGLPTEKWDVPLDAVLTETRLTRF